MRTSIKNKLKMIAFTCAWVMLFWTSNAQASLISADDFETLYVKYGHEYSFNYQHEDYSYNEEHEYSYSGSHEHEYDYEYNYSHDHGNDVKSVPEPGSLALFTLGLMILFLAKFDGVAYRDSEGSLLD